MGVTRNALVVSNLRAQSPRGNGDQGGVPTHCLVRARLRSAVHAETFPDGVVDDFASIDWIGIFTALSRDTYY